jgi:DNA-directed RNA polymerase subunit RPC12/RpoP
MFKRSGDKRDSNGVVILPYTTCPYCSMRSYSAADLEVWTCPYCNQKVYNKENILKESREQGE